MESNGTISDRSIVAVGASDRKELVVRVGSTKGVEPFDACIVFGDNEIATSQVIRNGENKSELSNTEP